MVADHRAACQYLVCHSHHGINHAAWVHAKINNQFFTALVLQGRKLLFKFIRRMPAEGENMDISDISLHHTAEHGGQAYVGTVHRKSQGFPVSGNGKIHFCSIFPTHRLGSTGKTQLIHRGAVNGKNGITALDASLFSRTSFKNVENTDGTVSIQSHDHADAAIFSIGCFHERIEGITGRNGGIRIFQTGEHPL